MERVSILDNSSTTRPTGVTTSGGARTELRSRRLIGYYSVACLILIGMAAFLANHFLTKNDYSQLIRVSEIRAIPESAHLATILAHQPELHESGTGGLSIPRLSVVDVMESVWQNPAIPAKIESFTILDPNRTTAYSTYAETRGTIHKRLPAFDSAIAGGLGIYLIDMPMKDGSIVTLVEIYRPLRSLLGDEESPIIGVLKTYHHMQESGTGFQLGSVGIRAMAIVLVVAFMAFVFSQVGARMQKFLFHQQRQDTV